MITINLSAPATKSPQCSQVPAESSLQNNSCVYCDAAAEIAGGEPQVSLGAKTRQLEVIFLTRNSN